MASLPLIRDYESIRAVMLLRYGETIDQPIKMPQLNLKSIAEACGISSIQVARMLKRGNNISTINSKGMRWKWRKI